MTLKHTLSALAALSIGTGGCVVKYSYHDFDDAVFDDGAERIWSPPLDAGLVTNDIGVLGVGAVALSVEAGNQLLAEDVVSAPVDLERVSLSSFGLSARVFPVARGPVRPFAGVGYGRSKLEGAWVGPNDAARAGACVGVCTETVRETFYAGWHPHLLGGVELRVFPGSEAGLLIEYRKDLDRGDASNDLAGSRISVGLRMSMPGM